MSDCPQVIAVTRIRKRFWWGSRVCGYRRLYVDFVVGYRYFFEDGTYTEQCFPLTDRRGLEEVWRPS